MAKLVDSFNLNAGGQPDIKPAPAITAPSKSKRGPYKKRYFMTSTDFAVIQVKKDTLSVKNLSMLAPLKKYSYSTVYKWCQIAKSGKRAVQFGKILKPVTPISILRNPKI